MCITAESPLGSPPTPSEPRRSHGLPRAVILLSLASFCNDVASEVLLKGALPLYLVGVLGAPMAVVGLIDGSAEMIATFLQLGTGWWSDRVGRRKPFVVMGYLLSNVTKPMLYFVGSWWQVLVIRITDRVGKGLRVAPRDALIAEVTPAANRGRAFGLHHALDPAGAMVSLIAGAAIVTLSQEPGTPLTTETWHRLILFVLIPGLFTILLSMRVKESRHPLTLAARRVNLRDTRSLGTPFWRFAVLTALFTLGNSTDSFIILRAAKMGVSLPVLFLCLAAFNLMSVVFSVPSGILSDRLGRRRFLACGWAIYGLVYAGFGFATDTWHVLVLLLLYGVYYGLTEGVSKAFIADLVEPDRRGTAYGFISAIQGLFILPAGVLAGWLWSASSPATPFLLGGVLAAISAIGLIWTRPAAAAAHM